LRVYFQHLRKKLIKVVEFQYISKDRFVLKQGDVSLSMFFILTGEVLISQLAPDKEAEKSTSQPANILSSGDFFGHVGLIYNTTRNASVSTESRLTMNTLFYLMRFQFPIPFSLFVCFEKKFNAALIY
jgi:CRP-like cAMP-binding protein